MSGPIIFTIGHSTHPIEEFIAMLQSHGVAQLIDIRTIPRSRTNPQFNKDVLPDSLSQAGIEYDHMKNLGGRRRPPPDAPNTAWRNDSFRGYADYMQTPEFLTALKDLIERAHQKPVAIMCAEAVPWRCHRFLVSDALLARDIPVNHIMSVGKSQPHQLRPWARMAPDLTITYRE